MPDVRYFASAAYYSGNDKIYVIGGLMVPLVKPARHGSMTPSQHVGYHEG